MSHNPPPDVLDVAIIGGGPAGLAAAVYLARFLRSVAVFDTGKARARRIPRTHNCPGFPDGIGGDELLRRLHVQARSFGAQVLGTGVEALAREDGRFVLTTATGAAEARYVILATGIVDRTPAIADVWGGVAAGLVRLCPVCDAYEVRDRRIGIVGPEELAVKEALYLRHYSRDVMLLFNHAEEVSIAARQQASAAGIELCDKVGDLVRREDGFDVVMADASPPLQIDVVYASMGCDVRSDLAAMVGAERDAHGYVLVGKHQEASVPRLYAIGDVAQALNQIAVGFGHAALAASDIHNALRLHAGRSHPALASPPARPARTR